MLYLYSPACIYCLWNFYSRELILEVNGPGHTMGRLSLMAMDMLCRLLMIQACMLHMGLIPCMELTNNK